MNTSMDRTSLKCFAFISPMPQMGDGQNTHFVENFHLPKLLARIR